MEKTIEPSLNASKSTDVSQSCPSPTNLERYLPWACSQLEGPDHIVITKITQQEYVSIGALSAKAKKKRVQSHDSDSVPVQPEKSQSARALYHDNVINILAYYDSNDNLAHLEFKSNPFIPRIIFRVLNLIAQFYVTLTTVTINLGLDEYIVHELGKLLHVSLITDVCLDNTSLKNNTYYSVLLEKQSLIRNLSLARCNLDDEAIKAIAEKLAYPLPASKTLSALTLTTNKITDDGAKHLAEALRSNRRLYYLNMSDNQLSDTGVKYILNSLCEFPLHFTEVLGSRYRHMTFLRERNELIKQKAIELRFSESEKKPVKKKPGKSAGLPIKRTKSIDLERDDENRSLLNLDYYMGRATVLADKIMGTFQDPFSKSDTYVKDGVVYCYGNNTMCYLNFSFNNLSLITVTKFLYVLSYQRYVDRKPRGLVSLSIEGNMLPGACEELVDLDVSLETNFALQRTHSVKKRLTVTKLFGNR